MEKLCDILDLPMEMRENIFKYCTVTDLVNIACCSKTYYDSVLHILWHTIRIPWEHVEDKSLVTCKKLEHLKFTTSLGFYSNGDHICCLMEDDNVNQLIRKREVLETYTSILKCCNLENLKEMYFSWPFHYQYMIKLPCRMFINNLRVLTLRDDYSVTGFWEDVGSLNFLQILNIDDCAINNNDMKQVINAKKLKELYVVWNTRMTDESIGYISTLSELTKFALKYTGQNVASNTFRMLEKLKNLTDLNLEYSSINDETLVYLGIALRHLETLSIAGCKEITDGSIVNLSTNTSIKSLNLNDTNITDNAMSEIVKLKLQKLYLRKTKITNLGLSYLRNLTSLKELNLSFTFVVDCGILLLSDMTSLEVLDVSCTRISLAAIKHLISLPAFKYLQVRDHSHMTSE